jgi:membrane protein CcdC involved in cytochrome C biogenesis
MVSAQVASVFLFSIFTSGLDGLLTLQILFAALLVKQTKATVKADYVYFKFSYCGLLGHNTML